MARHAARSVRPMLGGVKRGISAWGRFWRDYDRYRKMLPQPLPLLPFLFPCLGDDTAAHAIDAIYFYQDAWAFEKIFQARPAAHVDVGSHHKFVALLSKVVPVTMVDIRPLPLHLNTLTFQAGSILEMPFADESVPSLSCICVIEHIGLGRYGDPLDPDGTLKAIGELKRVLTPGGRLYISVPLDDEDRTYFNAHRAFTEETVLKLFAPFAVLDKKYIYGHGFLAKKQTGFGTGCYLFQKPA